MGEEGRGEGERGMGRTIMTTTATRERASERTNREHGTLHFVRIKKENWRGGWPWVGRCGLAWRGGGLGTGGHGLGGRPRVEAGEGSRGSRARTPSGQSQRVLTPRGCGAVGSRQGANMCSLPHPNH